MDSVIKSFWFWLLLIGMVAILASILIAGGMKEMKGWTWGFFVIGCVLALLGIIFGLIAWSRHVPCVQKTEETCSATIDSCGCDASPVSENLDSSSPAYVSPYSSSYVSSSPAGSSYLPKRVVSNAPQTERGFSTSSLNLSSLAPKTSQ